MPAFQKIPKAFIGAIKKLNYSPRRTSAKSQQNAPEKTKKKKKKKRKKLLEKQQTEPRKGPKKVNFPGWPWYFNFCLGGLVMPNMKKARLRLANITTDWNRPCWLEHFPKSEKSWTRPVFWSMSTRQRTIALKPFQYLRIERNKNF